jgi:exopolysaccharide biosynthesis polyprenyl glycosylphosphotransferase
LERTRARRSAIRVLPPPADLPVDPPLDSPTTDDAPPRATRPGRVADRTLLRWGVRPLFLAIDLAAFAAAAGLTGGLTGGSLVLLVLVVALYAAAGLYQPRLSLSALDDFPALAGRAIAAAAIATTLGVVLDVRAAGAPLLVTSLVLAVTAPVLRALAYFAVRRIRTRGVIAHPTLVLGAGRVGGQLVELLLAHPEYGLRPVGFLDSDPLLGEAERPVPLLGGHESLASVISEFGVHDVIVAFGSAPESAMVGIIRTCDRLNAEIFFVPRLFELHSTNRDVDQVWGLPLVRLRRAAFRSPFWAVKRALDVAVAGTALVLLSPVLAVCALAVRLEGGPGILFSQERVGLDGRPFRVLKFRSMKPRDEGDSQTTWSIANDDRVGPVGRILRTTSLDELPQLWNIVRGDMSLVGPRPERPHFVEQFTETFPRYTARHRVPAGLTGWAQVHGLRGDTSIEDRARFDNFYIENWSLWGDVKIMLRTAIAVVRNHGS